MIGDAILTIFRKGAMLTWQFITGLMIFFMKTIELGSIFRWD